MAMQRPADEHLVPSCNTSDSRDLGQCNTRLAIMWLNSIDDRQAPTCPNGSRWLLVNFSFWKETSCLIQ